MDINLAKKREKLYPKRKDQAIRTAIWCLVATGLFLVAIKLLPYLWHVLAEIFVSMIWHAE